MKKRLLSILTLPFLVVSCSSYLITYQTTKDISYGDYEERNLLDISFPNGKPSTSLVVFIHGGAWISGSKANYAEEFAKKYKDGYVYAAINYRYASEECHCNDILDDIQKAMLKIKDVCNENGYTINKVAFFGHSAGGHLSLLYAYKMKDVCPFAIGFVSSLSGPTDLSDEKYITDTSIGNSYYALASYMSGIHIDKANFDINKEELLNISPISYIDNACPTIISHGDIDDIVPLSNAIALKEKLDTTEAEHEFFLYKDSGHALDKDKETERLYNTKFKEYKNKYL